MTAFKMFLGEIPPVRKYNRIKEGERKRPPSGHKAPQCGAFSPLARDAPHDPVLAV